MIQITDCATISLHHQLQVLSSRNLVLALLVIQRISVYTFGLGYEEDCDNGTGKVASEEDPKSVCNANMTG